MDLRYLTACAVLLSLGTGACLSVDNPNEFDPVGLSDDPAEFEAQLGTTYLRLHFGLYGTLQNTGGMAAVMAFESFSSLTNAGMALTAALPRAALNNSVSSPFSLEKRRIYYAGSEAARIASNAVARLNTPGFTLGSAARDARARSFAEFVRGLSLGYIALLYDSSSIIHPGLAQDDPGPLAGYQEVMAAAVDALQLAIDAATAPAAGANGFPLPTNWLPSPVSFSAGEFVRLVRSYRARLRANVARTPVEREAVDWDAVIDDARNGVLTDHLISTNETTGPDNVWVWQWNEYGLWHQMPPFVIGMADVSGSYAAWLALPLEERGVDGVTPLIVTPDLRFPQGDTRAAQQADFGLPCNPTPCKRYFRNRTQGGDVFLGPSWGWSVYDHVRFNPWRELSGGIGSLAFLTRAELDLLEAEGRLRKGDYAAAAALINKTRTRSGLPAITAFDANSPVPGGADCVPQVPVGPGYDTVACGNLMEALKYEKRLETQFTHFGAWFLDMRGWGDLPEGTGLHWATPWEDLLARGYTSGQVYSTGGYGLGNSGTAGRGTYGW